MNAGNQAEVVEQRYRRLVDHSPDAMVVHEGGRVVYINPAGVRWIGAQSGAELVGHPITEFVHPDSVPAILAPIASLRHEGDTSAPSEVVMRRFDGTTLDVEAVSVRTVWETRPRLSGDLSRSVCPEGRGGGAALPGGADDPRQRRDHHHHVRRHRHQLEPRR